MDLFRYLSFKYQLFNSKDSRSDFIKNVVGSFLLLVFLTLLIFGILEILPNQITENTKRYVINFYLLLSLFSISIVAKKFHKEYFTSNERELLLVAPVSHLQVIVVRFVVILIEVGSIFVYLFFPFLIATVLQGFVGIEVLFFSMLQFMITCFVLVSWIHIVYGVVFLSLRRKYFSEKTSFWITVITYLVMVSILVYSQSLYSEAKSAGFLNVVFLPLNGYLEIVSRDEIGFDLISKYLLVSVNYIFILGIVAVSITKQSYKDGFLVVTSRDTNKGLRINKLISFVGNRIYVGWLKKDILSVLRNPSIFRSFLTVSLFLLVIESRYHYMNHDVSRIIFINISTFMFLCVVTNIIFQDDYKSRDFTLYLPINLDDVYKSKTTLAFTGTALYSGLFLMSVQIFMNDFSVVSILHIVLGVAFFSYIGSRVYVFSTLKQNIKKRYYYSFEDKYTKAVIQFLLGWNLILIISSTIVTVVLFETISALSLMTKAISLICVSMFLLYAFKKKIGKIEEYLRGKSYVESS